jgi:hypothetical protein
MSLQSPGAGNQQRKGKWGQPPLAPRISGEPREGTKPKPSSRGDGPPAGGDAQADGGQSRDRKPQPMLFSEQDLVLGKHVLTPWSFNSPSQ